MKKSLTLLFLFVYSFAWVQNIEAQNTKYIPMERHIFNISAALADGKFAYATIALTFGRYDIDENDQPRPTFNYLEAMVKKVFADHNSGEIASEEQQQALKQKISETLNSKLTKGGVVDVTFINFAIW